jgi:hypothetical protein
MANLTASAGTLTASTGTVTNTKFLEWANAFIRSRRTPNGLPVADNATNQEKMQWLINQIGREFREEAINQLKREAEEAARVAANDPTDFT